MGKGRAGVGVREAFSGSPQAPRLGPGASLPVGPGAGVVDLSSGYRYSKSRSDRAGISAARPCKADPSAPSLRSSGGEREQATDKSRRGLNAKTGQKQDLRANLREFRVFGLYFRVNGSFPYWSGNPSSCSLSRLQSSGLLLTKGLYEAWISVEVLLVVLP